MNIVKVNLEDPEREVVQKIASSLMNGLVIAMPFDTSYGLAADATNPDAIQRLFLIKKREVDKPISIVVKDYPTLEDLCEVPNEELRKFILKFLPGKVTFVLRASDSSQIAKSILGKDGTIGVRIPDFKLVKEVAWEFGKPFTATSANLSGQQACFAAEEVVEQFSGKEYQPDLLVDGGVLPKSEMSTVVDVTVWPPLILRPGAVVIGVE